MITSLLLIDWTELENRIGTERVSNILWFAGIIIATLLLKKPLSLMIAKLSCTISNRFSDKRHAKLFQGLIIKPVELLLITLLFYIAVNQLRFFLQQVIFRRLHDDKLVEIRISDVADKLFIFLLILFFIWTVSRIVDFIFHVIIAKAYEEDNKEKEQLLPLVREVVKMGVWTIGIFWVFGTVFNVNIPALITGLGIGAVAIALAAKESVENFFASFTILTDKPFQTGDVVKLGSLEGMVEQIGFRSTRLRNADGSLYIIPNKKLINENLENLSQRDTRRVRVVFNVKYGMPSDRLQPMIDELKLMIRKVLHVIDPVNVALETFGENSFQLVLNYHLPEPLAEGASPDAIKQEINLNAYTIIARYTGDAPVPSSEHFVNGKPSENDKSEDLKDEPES